MHDTTEDARAIRALIDRWLQATRAHDVEAVLALMSDDVMFLVQGQAPFGKAAFAEGMHGQAQAGIDIDARSEILELTVDGQHAYVVSRLRVDVHARSDAAPMGHAGHALTVLRREAGGWRIVRDANLLDAVAEPSLLQATR